MGGFLGFCYRQLTFTPKPLPPTISLQGKTALITGANSGLGLEAVRQLAAHDITHLILAVRDVFKGETVKASILSTTPTPSCTIEIWPLDHDSPTSIDSFGARLSTLPRLDFALLNAGVKKLSYTKSPQTGHELNLQTNHIATSALSLLVLPVLQRTARQTSTPSRLTIVSSEGHFWIPFKEKSAPNILARMDEESSFGTAMQRYYTTKLLNVLWTRELATKVDAREVVVNTVNPGFCYSGLHRHESTGIIKVPLWLWGWEARLGGYCLVDALVGHVGEKEEEEVHGGYLSEQRVTTPSRFVLSDEGREVQKRVWRETMEILEKEVPGVNAVMVK